MSKPLKGFITYAHKNTAAKDELITRLDVMQQQNKLMTWHDAEMIGGDKWREEIFKYLADSDILLYLVSAASLASKNCNKELAEAVSSDIRIIPIILEHCDWKHHQLSEFQAFPDRGKPISEWQPEDRGWQDAVDGIRRVIEEMQVQADSPSEESEREFRAELAFQQGNVFMMLGQITRAIEAYSLAIELYPDNLVIYSNRGAAYRNIGDYDRAIEDYNKAIKLNPNYAEIYDNRGNAYSNKGDYDRAIEDYNKSIELNPDFAITYYNRATAYIHKGDYNRAIEDYNRAIELNPNYAEGYYNRATAYVRKGDVDCAIIDYTKAIDLNPNYIVAYNDRGGVHGIKGDFARALVDLNKAIDLKPDDANAYTNRGIVYVSKGDNVRALVDLNKGIDLKPDGANAYYIRGITHLHLQAWEEAKSDLTSARDKGMDVITAFHNDYGSVKAYGRKNRVKLPADIAAMLTP